MELPWLLGLHAYGVALALVERIPWQHARGGSLGLGRVPMGPTCPLRQP